MSKDYYLGLDIGTDSVGWAVTDTDYRILKFKGNAMWGTHITDEAKTAKDRRAFRCARRRTERARQRLDLLESLFSAEITKTDPSFFVRLKESDLYSEDKSTGEKYSVFADKGYTDKDYHKQYKTIYHLRSELLKSREPHDIRLVYLALHHIIKHRGHFLFDSDFSKMPNSGDVFNEFINYLFDNYGIEFDCSVDIGDEFINILKDKTLSKTKKAEKLFALFNVNKKTDRQAAAVLKTICGSKVKLCDIFDDDELQKADVCFSESFDEKASELEALLQERFELLEKLKAVYDFALLDIILNGKTYISEAKVEVYEKHGRDLKLLKEYAQKYLPKETGKEIFKASDNKCNYVAYSGHCKKSKKSAPIIGRCSYADFNSYLKKTLGKCCDEAYSEMFAEIENGTFLKKQVSKDNSVIPMQLGKKELEKILENAGTYLQFLNEKDENGITVAEKVLSILSFRTPYYIGPINSHANSFWAVRKEGKENEKIYPWNFYDVVDVEASAEGFINNLTNKCSYLEKYDVIPKNSLLYSKFCVLNELNNLKIDGNKPSVALKQAIFEDLFKTGRRVTGKALKDYLKSQNVEFETLGGFDGSFKSTLKPFADLARFEKLSYDEKEAAITAITVFGDDKKLLKSRLKKLFSKKLSEEEINLLSKLKYSDWGKLSKEFLTELSGCYKETGECLNIITALWETNLNLMEILFSNAFYCDGDENKTFDMKIREEKSFKECTTLKEAVAELRVSPKVKRPIYRALLITKEIEKIMKCPPKKVFVEVARGDGVSGAVTVSRKTELLRLYEPLKDTCRELYESLNEHSDADLRSKKLYLYYTQRGRCMYTGRTIDLESLMSNNSEFDIDHIYPRSKIKDDSLSNLVLVYKPKNQEKNNSNVLPAECRKKMGGFWRELLEKGLISPEKYKRLTRTTELSSEELSAFVSRQIVETGQATKAVANILEEFYKKDGTRIVYVKASLVSSFRQGENSKNPAERVEMLKCREVNDFHHAKDAYLNIVVGNVYDVKVTCNLIRFIDGLKLGNVSLNRMFDYSIKGAWDAENGRSMAIVKNTMAKNNIRFTRYLHKGKGKLFKVTILKKGDGQVPQKAFGPKADIDKYGGFDKATTAYFSLVKYREKNKNVLRLVPIDIYKEKEYLSNPDEYVSKYHLVNTSAKVVIECVKIDSCISFDGCRMNLSGKSNMGKTLVFKPGVQLVLSYEDEVYVKRLFKYIQSFYGKFEAGAFDGISPEKNIELYDLLLEKMTTTVYRNFTGAVQKTLEKGRENFVGLKPGDQCFVLCEIINILRSNVLTGDLGKIGGAKKAGSFTNNSLILKEGDSVKTELINQSVTGLFEQKINLADFFKEP